MSPQIIKALLLPVFIIIFLACHKHTSSSESVLVQDEKETLLARVRADTLYKEWITVMNEGFAVMHAASKSGKIDTLKMKATTPSATQGEHIKKMEDAGMYNAKEFHEIANRGMELLRQLRHKYPGLNKLSPEEVAQLWRAAKSVKQP